MYVLEKLLLALIMTLCLNLLVVVRLSNNSNDTTSSLLLGESITIRKQWPEPTSRNWQQHRLSPIAAK